jgi:Tuberculosis necrotizing toxin
MTRPSSVLNGTRPRPIGGRNLGEFLEPEDAEEIQQARLARIAERPSSAAPPASSPNGSPAGTNAEPNGNPSPATAQRLPPVASSAASNQAAAGRVVSGRGQDRYDYPYEPDDSYQSWAESFAPPPAVSAAPRAPAPATTFTSEPSATSTAPPATDIDLETDHGSTQLRFNVNQQAFVAPPPAQLALTATASAAATVATPPASAVYIGERPADVAWLTGRETALVNVRTDFEAQRARAQTQVPSFGGLAGPGWLAFSPTVDHNGSELSPAAGQLVVEVRDPNAPAEYGGDENGSYASTPSQRYVFDEAAFPQYYQAESNARPDSALQTLARNYNTDAASLLSQHPEMWAIATSDHAIDAGPAQAGRAMGSLQMLAPIEMTLADPQNAALIKAYGGTPEPATSPIALEQVRIYGAERYAQMCRLSNAMQAVRDQYSQAVEQAVNSGAGPGWSLQPKTVSQQVGMSGDNDVYADVVVMQPTFDVDAFTTWYEAQGGLSNKAFKDFYGASLTMPGSEGGGSGEDRIAATPSSTTFANAHWQMTGFGGALQHTDLTSIDLNNHPDLNDDAYVGFDPVSGWMTPTANLHQKQDWLFTAAIVAMVVVVSCVTYGAASTWATGAGYGAVATGAIAGGAAGAAGSFVSGAMNDNLTLKGVLQGALSGALAGAATGALNAGFIVPAGSVAPGTVGGCIANFTVNTAVQALMQGKITDQMLLTSLATAAGTTLAVNLADGIDKAVKAGTMSATEAFAAQALAKMMTAAVRAMASPDDPGYAFANALLSEVMQPLGDAARDAGAARWGNAGVDQRNGLDLQSDDAHDAKAAQQSDDILARRADEIAAANGLNPTVLPDGRLQYADGSIKTPSVNGEDGSAFGDDLIAPSPGAAPGRGFWNSQNQWVPDSNGGVVPVGVITPSRYALTDVPDGLQSKFGPIRAAWDHVGQGYWVVPTDADGGFRIMSPPDGYQVPSRASFDVRALANGFGQTIIAVPAGMIDLMKASVDGYAMAADMLAGGGGDVALRSRLVQGLRDGSITWGTVLRDGVDASPVGFLINAAGGDYEAAGGSLAGTGVGLAAGPAATRLLAELNGLPLLGADVVGGAQAVAARFQQVRDFFAGTQVSDDVVARIANNFGREGDAFTMAAEQMAAARDAGWVLPSGRVWYPDGYAVPGTEFQTVLSPGMRLDRYGGTSRDSSFLSPTDVSIEQRALKPSANLAVRDEYVVIREFTVEQSNVMPWFGKPGMGVQFNTDFGVGKSIADLVELGFIKKVGP